MTMPYTLYSTVGNLSVLFTFHGFVPFFSMTKPVLLFSFMSGSGFLFFSLIFSCFRSVLLDDHAIYSTVGNLSVFLTFLCRLCVRFLIYVMFVLFSVRISVRLFCVLSTCIVFFSMTKPVLLFLFMSGSGLSDLWPPRIFWPFLSCFTSSCVVSVRISVRLFCVPSTCIVSCIWLSFTL